MDGIRLLIILTQLKHWHHSGESTVMVKRNRSRFNISRKIKSHFKGGEIRPERRSMETFQIYTPVAKGKPQIDKLEVFANLLMFGEENAVPREELTVKCIEAGLISKDSKDPDRGMRKLLQRARKEYVILNDGKGNGYYRPTSKELIRLSKSNKRENGRAIEVFKSNQKAKALEEDFKYGRVAGDE